MKRKIKTKQFGILVLFSVIVFLAVLINALIAAVTVYLFIKNGVIDVSNATYRDAGRLISFFTAFSIPIGILIAVIASKVPLKPVRDLIESMDKLSSGDFKTRVNVGHVMRRYPPFVEVAESFNIMAEHLQSTEMLRSDFINNLSHEFKTPIVSIAGFAKLLRRGNLPPEVQQEYLGIIEEESMRLSYMATNVLNLTKVENQTILTDVSEYNLSEQLRSCILLLESKWAKKALDFSLNMEEHQICANEELLKQVWINLLDNAIKFSPESGLIAVSVTESGTGMQIAIQNTGPAIPPEKLEKIFNKFYQCDESHATEGNGVGLAIVKRIVELHSGGVRVTSEQGSTTFVVTLPRK